MKNKSHTATLILAAGASTRLGKPKQLVKINGKYLLETIAEKALESFGENTIIILGAYVEKIKKSIEHLPVHILENKNWEHGMGSSISLGISYMENNFPEINGTYILLSDQPYVDAHILKKIESENLKNNRKIIASKYEDTYGPPAYFPKHIFPELKKLNGEKGAKSIFSKYRNELIFVDFPKGKYDIDTPEDLNWFKKNCRNFFVPIFFP